LPYFLPCTGLLDMNNHVKDRWVIVLKS
jgi:hypothetical protein